MVRPAPRPEDRPDDQPDDRPDERSDERGAVALVVALLTVVLAGLAALVVDLGLARDIERTAQNAADAAALAAATSLAAAVNPAAVTTADIDQARTVATRYAVANGWASGIATFSVDPSAATVSVALAPVQSPQMFAGAIGSSTPTVGASAQATWRGAPAPCALCVLGDLGAQNGQTVTSVGSILVGGSLSVSPNGVVQSNNGIIGVVGSLPTSGTVSPAPVNVASVTDPYSVTPRLPPGPPAPALGAPAGTATGPACVPGTYSNIQACRTFASGVYVITGANSFSGSTVIDASSGVLFYFTCSAPGAGGTVSAACGSGAAGGSIDFRGNVVAVINPLPDPAYRGLAIIYDRNNTARLGLVGGTGVTVNGGVYAASATLGNNGSGVLVVHGTVVVAGVDLRGAPSTVTIDQGNAYADLPPMLTHLIG
jgi:Flp pilus assembly protein TadG